MLALIVAVMSSACFATNPYTAGTDQAKLWDAIDTNFIVLKGPPAQLQRSSSGQMHAALRELDEAMPSNAGATQIDDFPSDDASPALLDIKWSRSNISSSTVDIVICTTINSGSATPSAAVATISRGESSAYADGGNHTGTISVRNGGAATSTASAPTCIACAIGGQTTGATGAPGSVSTGGFATATTSNSDCSAIVQGGDESTRGGAASATSTGTNSNATAFGGNSTKKYTVAGFPPHSVGHKGGDATAQSTATSVAHGGRGADNAASPNISGSGGDATINGAANSSTETATGGDPGAASDGATAGATGQTYINQ